MLEKLLESYPDSHFVVMDGYNEAIIGVTETNAGSHLLYSQKKVFDILIRDHGIENYEGCYEWYYHNMLDLTTIENGIVFMLDVNHQY